MALDLLPFLVFGGSVNPLWQPPYRLLLRGPGAPGPQRWGRRIGPFSEQSHRLTSPMLRALLSFLTAKTSRTSAPFRVGYLCLATALSAPLQGGLRFLRPLLPPTPSPSLRSGYRRGGRHGASPVSDREAAGGGGWSLGPGGGDGCRRALAPHAVLPTSLLGSACQPYFADLALRAFNGSSLAFNLPVLP